MAGNNSEWRGRENSSRERDNKRAPTRAISKERVRSPGTVAVAARGRAPDSRTTASNNPRRAHSLSSRHRSRSTSHTRQQDRGAAHRRPRSPDERRARNNLDSLHGEKAGEDKSSSHQAERRPPIPVKRRQNHSPSPSRPHSRDPKRRRSRSRDRSYSSRPGHEVRASRRPSLDHNQPQVRRRSRSTDSRYRHQSTKYPRRPSPDNRTRAREQHRNRYRSPPHHGRRRYTPPPDRRSHRERDERDPRYRYEEYYGTRHSKPAARSPSRELKRSPSPTDLISQLATDVRREEAESSRPRAGAHSTRRTSRSPPPEHTHRDYRDKPRERGRDWGRGYDTNRRDHYNTSPRRDKHRAQEDDDAMYGRGGYPRPPAGRQPYVDPRYSHSPPYPPAMPNGHSPPHAHSPYGRGGYAGQPSYGSHHG